MTRPPITTLLAAVTTVAAFTLTGCGANRDHGDVTRPGAAQLPAVAVTTTTVTAIAVPQVRRLPGTVQATNRATVAARIMGTVTAAPQLGQSVAADDLLVTLAAAEFPAAVAAATAALDLATRNHAREAALLERGASTAETVRNLEDQRRIAAAQLAAANARLDDLRIRAPFPGTVTARHLEPGDLAAPGAPLFTLEGPDLEVQVAVPATLTAVSTGHAVPIELDDRTTVAATVTEMSPAVDPVTRSRLVRLALPAGTPVTAGHFVRVRWPDQPATVLTVPDSAVAAFGQMQRVFVATTGHASLRFVQTGHRQDGTTVILSGLNPGESIVNAPPANLRDGQPLTLNASR